MSLDPPASNTLHDNPFADLGITFAESISDAPTEVRFGFDGTQTGAASPRPPAPLPPQLPIDLSDVAAIHSIADIDPDADLHSVLLEAIRRGASDVHITAGMPPMIRVLGELQPVSAGSHPRNADAVEAELFALLTERQADTLRSTSELDFALTVGTGQRFRVNVFRQRGTHAAAFRLVPEHIRNLNELGMPSTVAQFAATPRGLVLVTGPTGSGKTTTLAALLDLVNARRSCHIMTIEDPIEFVHSNRRSIVNQREVGEDTADFTTALRQVLRQDPDVILIGEMRDYETISIALTAAETGHLVFASLHTQTASQTIDRIVDAFPAHQQNQVRMQLASSLQGVICQTLVPRQDRSGRVAATEILHVTPAVANLIREGKHYQIPTAIQAGQSNGMMSLEHSLASLVRSNTIAEDEARARIADDEQFTRLLRAGTETTPRRS